MASRKIVARSWTDFAFLLVRIRLVVVVTDAALCVPCLLFFGRPVSREERLHGLVVHIRLRVRAWPNAWLGHVTRPDTRSHAPAVLPVDCAFGRLLDSVLID